MVILGQHETFLLVIQYVFALFAGGWICFKWLFPMLGWWIVNQCKKLEDANKCMEQERKAILKQEELGTEEHFATENQIVKVLTKEKKTTSEKITASGRSNSLGKINIGKEAQRRADDKCVIDGLYMDESDIKSAYERNGFPTSVKQRQKEQDDDKPICAPWLGQPK